TPDLISCEDRFEVTLLLARRAELDDRWAGEILSDDVQPLRCTGPIELLVEHRTQLRVRATTAVFLRPRQAGITCAIHQPLPRPPIVELVLQHRRLGTAEGGQRVFEPTAYLSAEFRLGRTVFQVHQLAPETSWIWAACSWMRPSMSLRISCLRTLPVAVIGRDSTATTRSGVF